MSPSSVGQGNNPQQVAAAILFREGRLLLAKRAAPSSLPGVWELPGGKVEDPETPEQCLAREMDEEFGVTVRVGPLLATSAYTYDHGSFEILAHPVETVAHELEARVHETIGWFSLDEALGLDLAPADVPIIEELRRRQG